MWSMKEHIFDVDYLQFSKAKRVRVYLPNSYENSSKTYPVVYFHDGAAVFFGKNMFGTGSWEVLDTLTKMEANSTTEGFIAIAVDNAEVERADEFLPWENTYTKGHYHFGTKGGKADDYAKFFVEVLKPFIDDTYRTKPEQSSICGSSMGGLITAYIVSKYPETFIKAGVFSIASWVYSNNEWNDYLYSTAPNKNMKYFVYVGAQEGHIDDDLTHSQTYIDDALAYYKFLLKKDVSPDNIEMIVNAHFGHNEAAWSCYVEKFLMF